MIKDSSLLNCLIWPNQGQITPKENEMGWTAYNGKISAIKAIRDEYNVSLKDAKDAIDRAKHDGRYTYYDKYSNRTADIEVRGPADNPQINIKCHNPDKPAKIPANFMTYHVTVKEAGKRVIERYTVKAPNKRSAVVTVMQNVNPYIGHDMAVKVKKCPNPSFHDNRDHVYEFGVKPASYDNKNYQDDGGYRDDYSDNYSDPPF